MDINFFNIDCIEFMKQKQDNFYDLAIVDPPYAIGFDNYKRGGNKRKTRYTKDGVKNWDNEIPTNEYFEQLFRVSKNQIIFGGNYFHLPPTQCFIFWYKNNPVPNFSDGEYAWTSFKQPAICIDYRYYGNLENKTKTITTRIHPTQKPINLYRIILKKFAKNNYKILDTHGGSGTIASACYMEKFSIDICEIDQHYYNNAIKNFNQFKLQTNLF
jgi:site-specific DNA-methyltransferase (adenine-specific)